MGLLGTQQVDAFYAQIYLLEKTGMQPACSHESSVFYDDDTIVVKWKQIIKQPRRNMLAIFLFKIGLISYLLAF